MATEREIELEAECVRLGAESAQLRVLLDAQSERIASLESKVADLTARLGQDSSNSSAPPSRDRTDRRARRAAERAEAKAKRSARAPLKARRCRAGRCIASGSGCGTPGHRSRAGTARWPLCLRDAVRT